MWSTANLLWGLGTLLVLHMMLIRYNYLSNLLGVATDIGTLRLTFMTNNVTPGTNERLLNYCRVFL